MFFTALDKFGAILMFSLLRRDCYLRIKDWMLRLDISEVGAGHMTQLGVEDKNIKRMKEGTVWRLVQKLNTSGK